MIKSKNTARLYSDLKAKRYILTNDVKDIGLGLKKQSAYISIKAGTEIQVETFGKIIKI